MNKAPPVRGELILKPPREADKVLGSESASRNGSAKSAVRDRHPPLPPSCLHRASDGFDDGCNRPGSQQAFVPSRGHSRKACDPNTHGGWFRSAVRQRDATVEHVEHFLSHRPPVYLGSLSSASWRRCSVDGLIIPLQVIEHLVNALSREKLYDLIHSGDEFGFFIYDIFPIGIWIGRFAAQVNKVPMVL
jgi:hypothetical protein